ncbi:MAG: hypothetical protein ABFS16_14615 [Bacteroidota bacterium]
MKTLIILFGIILISLSGFPQLIQDKTMDGKLKPFSLENGEIKYIDYNQKKQILNIFNLNSSIWKSIHLPLPKGHFLNEVKLISKHTFDKNELVEILYSCVVYNHLHDYENPEDYDNLLSFTLNIINEKGEFLLKVEDSNDYEIIKSDENTKLFVYKHISKGINEKMQTLVYTVSL